MLPVSVLAVAPGYTGNVMKAPLPFALDVVVDVVVVDAEVVALAAGAVLAPALASGAVLAVASGAAVAAVVSLPVAVASGAAVDVVVSLDVVVV
ncbi:MAG TPA: hypothetical protein VHT53_03575 [Candidatus Elarobacter sp.]|jgi:hypothetical protein|nr:hypothetical protein [Candidatus Elarobacter sp.]